MVCCDSVVPGCERFEAETMSTITTQTREMEYGGWEREFSWKMCGWIQRDGLKRRTQFK